MIGHDSTHQNWNDWEARLRAQTPQITLAAQQDLLYQCAFQAGQQKSHRSLRIWQGGTLILGLALTLSWFTPRPLDRTPMAKNQEAPAPSDTQALPQTLEPPDRVWVFAKDSQNEETIRAFERHLERFALWEPHEKELTMARIGKSGLFDH